MTAVPARGGSPNAAFVVNGTEEGPGSGVEGGAGGGTGVEVLKGEKSSSILLFSGVLSRGSTLFVAGPTTITIAIVAPPFKAVSGLQKSFFMK